MQTSLCRITRIPPARRAGVPAIGVSSPRNPLEVLSAADAEDHRPHETVVAQLFMAYVSACVVYLLCCGEFPQAVLFKGIARSLTPTKSVRNARLLKTFQL